MNENLLIICKYTDKNIYKILYNFFINIYILKNLIYILLVFTFAFASGGYDNGTSAGKGQIEVDLTWNPFDLIEFGQTYAVVGLGLTKRFDIHGYFAHQNNDNNNYYYGVFYQFLDVKYIDLAAAIGYRQYTKSDELDLFFPQVLYTLKITNNFNIGGALVYIKRKYSNDEYVKKGSAFDITALFTLNDLFKLPKYIEDLKLGIGLFNPGIFEPDHGDFLPTYSIDITFKKMWGK